MWRGYIDSDKNSIVVKKDRPETILPLSSILPLHYVEGALEVK
jgi:hypothetical protein